MKTFLRSHAVAVLCAAFAVQPARAQQATEKLERIEVTGSRIATTDVESASPVVVIRAEEIKAEGYQFLELAFNNFPQFVASQGNRVSNSATGTANASLRGLFPERTLVLLNGRRMVPGSPFLLAADLNQVPVPLISRVEILTGGASAVYGSDAIAGVINIILDDKFDGVRGEVAYDFYNHRQKNGLMQGLLRQAGYEIPADKTHDGATTTTSLALGGVLAGDKGHASVLFRHSSSDALMQTERDYSACALSVVNPGTANGRLSCGGSVNSYPGRFVGLGAPGRWTVADTAGGVRPFVSPADLYNFSPWNYYQRPVERYGFDAFAGYETAALGRIYVELGFHDDHTVAQIAPSGIFGELFAIRYDNPLLSDSWRSTLFRNPDGSPRTDPGAVAQVLINRRNSEGGPRQYDIRHTSSREVVGTKGELPGGWHYDVFAQNGKVVMGFGSFHNLSRSRTARALDVVRDPATGNAVCASVLNGTDSGCVPYNLWSLGGVSASSLAYLETSGFQRGYTSQAIASATVSGDLGRYGLRLPWTRESIEVAAGLEWRRDRMELESDVAMATRDLAGDPEAKPPLVRGEVAVKEVFAEARVPILDVMTVTGSFRHSDYNIGKATDTYGLGINAAPTRNIRVRGSYQRAVRAPNVYDLFTPQTSGFWGLPNGDPCAGPTPTRSLADCRRTGVTAEQYGHIEESPSGAYPATFGGNPDVAPETAQTFTLGAALTMGSSLSATLDYFDIRVDDFIYSGTPEVTFQRCIDTGDPHLCGRIQRDSVFGSLWIAPANVVAINQNLGRVRVAGADFAVNYRQALAHAHAITLSVVGTYLRSFTVQKYRGGEVFQCAGAFFYECGDPRPKWRHRVRATWQTPWDVELSASWRYMGSTTDLYAPTGGIKRLNAVSYLDVGTVWAITKRMTLRLGASNVTDRDPPLLSGGTATANGNTFVQAYDALGRHIHASLTARF